MSPPNFSSATGHPGGSASPSLATRVPDHVSLRGGRPGAPVGRAPRSAASGASYQGPRIGVPARPAAGSRSPGRATSRRSSAAARAPATTPPRRRHLLGAFAGMIVVIVLAAMFVTAEYRRGLIRTTLAASPRRGRLLAAKALVIGLVTFVAGPGRGRDRRHRSAIRLSRAEGQLRPAGHLADRDAGDRRHRARCSRWPACWPCPSGSVLRRSVGHRGRGNRGHRGAVHPRRSRRPARGRGGVGAPAQPGGRVRH